MGLFLHTNGEWDKAEQSLLAGKQSEECQELATYLLSQLYAYRGEHQQALRLIDDAMEKFPQVPYFYFEKVKNLVDLQCYEEMIDLLDQINRMLPYHAYKSYFVHLRAEALYKMNKSEELLALLKKKHV